jgi:hypothetical protein
MFEALNHFAIIAPCDLSRMEPSKSDGFGMRTAKDNPTFNASCGMPMWG